MKKSLTISLILASLGALRTASLTLCVALAASGAASAGTTGLYVQDGLIACWDGIENAGAGIHNASAAVWKDVVGGYEFSLTGVTVDADRMTFAGSSSSYGTLSASGTTATFVAAKNGTMEIVYASRNAASSQVLLQSTSGSGLAFGYSSKGNIIPSTINSSLFPYTLDTAKNSVSIRYSAGIPMSPIYTNGWSLAASSSKDYWGSPNSSSTFIGNRASKAAGFPGSIYCIRLYSRQLTDAEIAINHTVDGIRFKYCSTVDALCISSSPDGVGSPSPAYGVTNGLVAGDSFAVSCGASVVTDVAGTTQYSCTGWKLYDETDAVVSNGAETTFTYVHPTPAEYRRLEWQWAARDLLGIGNLAVVTNGGDHIVFSTDVTGIGYTAPSATLKFVYGFLPDELVWTNAVNSSISSIGTVQATLPRLTPGAFYYIKAILETNDQVKDAVETGVVAIRTASYDGDASSWQDETAPILTGVTLDGTGSDTLGVSGNLASFTGDSCALRVLIGPSPETMTNVWSGLGGSTLDATGAFSLTLHEADCESVRYLAPYSTYYAAIVATSSNGKVSVTPVLSVTMSPKSHWTYVEVGVDQQKIGYGYVTDGAWKLYAKRTQKNVTTLWLSGSGGKFYGAAPSPMNFTNVRDEGGVAYQVVEFSGITRRNSGQLLYDQGPMLTELIAPDCVSFSLEYNFCHCTSMTNVVLNANFNVLRSGSFNGCASLRTIYPRRMMCATVPYDCFRLCSNLEGTLELPVCTTIGGYAFSSCTSLHKVVATNATVIGDYAFSGCTGLYEVIASPALTQVGISGFNGCTALRPDFLGTILGKSLRYLGQSNFAKMEAEFAGCSSLTGQLVWDFPNLATNVVNKSGFSGCSSLEGAVFKTPVAQIRDYAFNGLKAGAELHMHAQAPVVFGALVAGSQTAPYPRIYLKDNFNEWLSVMNAQQDLLRRADFDNTAWSSKVRADTITWADMAKEMAKDTTLCSVEKSGNTITKVNVDKKVLGIMLYCHNHQHWMCWVLREPKPGTVLLLQ